MHLETAIAILERTPLTLKTWLPGLPDEWIYGNEGEHSWSPYDIVGHFVHGERTDWIPRAEIILSDIGDKKFKTFNRFAQFEESQGKTLDELLEIFAKLRSANISRLQGFNLDPADFDRTGIHPELGTVTLGQLIATWTAHDLNHLSHIAEVMARQYREAVGPWRAYLDILDR